MPITFINPIVLDTSRNATSLVSSLDLSELNDTVNEIEANRIERWRSELKSEVNGLAGILNKLNLEESSNESVTNDLQFEWSFFEGDSLLEAFVPAYEEEQKEIELICLLIYMENTEIEKLAQSQF